MAAVGFWVSRSLDPGIKLSGALFLQSFEKKKEFMKLLKSEACHPAPDGGNVKRMTVMGDAWMDRLSDRGSIPLRSTKAEQVELCIWYYRIQEYVLFGVSKKIKVTTLYVTKVIYSVVIFML